MPPYLPSGPVLEPVTHVLTTRLVLDSRGYGCPEVKALCRALSRVVVETCEEACCMVLDLGGGGAAEEVLEYDDMR